MAKDEALFSKLDSTIKIKVKLGNGQVVESHGKGSVMVQTKQGTKFIHDVLFVPSLAQNLFSVVEIVMPQLSHRVCDNCRITLEYGKYNPYINISQGIQRYPPIFPKKKKFNKFQ